MLIAVLSQVDCELLAGDVATEQQPDGAAGHRAPGPPRQGQTPRSHPGGRRQNYQEY